MAPSKSASKMEVTDEVQTTTTATPQAPAKQTFESIYLQQMSREFADDLEKLRTANDFKGERSVQILVEALKQGTACFSEDEQRKMAPS